MRKILKDINAFAMAELLAVSIVILLIFTVLFSNYLPLVGEYETRLSYNDVTSQYAAHYIRKEYKNWLEGKGYYEFGGNETQVTRENQLGINSNAFTTVYKENSSESQTIYNICNSSNNEGGCKKNIKAIIEDYGIEEIIITNYKLGNPNDTAKKYVKNTYEKKDGLLKKYIDYLPNYEKSIYTGKTEDEDSDQLYRIIMKTKYGYATTPILDDYKTPGTCFEGKQNISGLIVTKYHSEKEDCGSSVTISKGAIKIIDETNSNKTLTGQIVQIGDGENSIDDNPKKTANAPGIQEIFIKGGLTTIASKAFKDKEKLKKVIFPDTTERYKLNIGDNAFEDTGLTEINLPTYATYGNYAFANNKNLVNIDLSLVENDMENSGTYLFEKAGSSAANGLSEIKFSNKITKIPTGMFYMAKFTNQLNITFPNNLKTIGKLAFANATDGDIKNNEYDTSILNVSLPSTVTKIDSYAFSHVSIKKLYFNSIQSSPSMEIETKAFYRTGISNVAIPLNTIKIGMNAFANNDVDNKIQNLTFKSSTKKMKILGYAFYDNSIVNVNLFDNVEYLGEYAFANNKSLSNINISNSLNELSDGVFNSTGLTTITIPSTITKIKQKAFQSCGSLSKVIFADDSKVSTIEQNAFSSTKLSNIILPASIEKLGTRVFSGCGNLKEVISYSNIYKDTPANWCGQFYSSGTASQCEESVIKDGNVVTISGNNATKTITYMNSEEGING